MASKMILVVEDDSCIREILKLMLESLGHRVVVANNGLGALDLVAQGLQFDVLFTDLNMPRLRGDDLIVRLRELGFSRQPMFIVTGDCTYEPMPEQAIKCLYKPFRAADLERLLS